MRGATVSSMAGDDLTPRPRRRLSRSERESRGYRLVVVGGVAGAISVVTAVLAIAGVLGWGVPFLTLVVAAVCGLLFRRLAGQR